MVGAAFFGGGAGGEEGFCDGVSAGEGEGGVFEGVGGEGGDLGPMGDFFGAKLEFEGVFVVWEVVFGLEFE